jgi:hypothetical protein
VDRLIDHLQVVTTNNYNTSADFHTTNHSTLSLLSLPSLVLYGNRSPQWLFLCSVFTRRFLVSNLQPPLTPPTWRDRSPYLYPPGIGWPSYTPGHWVPFSSSPTTCRATWSVESYSLGADPQRTPLATPLLLLRDVTAYVLRVTYRDNSSIVACTRLFVSTVLVLSKYATIFCDMGFYF